MERSVTSDSRMSPKNRYAVMLRESLLITMRPLCLMCACGTSAALNLSALALAAVRRSAMVIVDFIGVRRQTEAGTTGFLVALGMTQNVLMRSFAALFFVAA